MIKLSPKQAKRALIFLFGLLLVLLGLFIQISSTSKKASPEQNQNRDRDLLPRLRASLMNQSRNLQRCWLQNAQSPKEQVWQIFVEVKPSGQVTQFRILNSESMGEETVKCLNEMGLRMRFPTFEGENFSFTIPIRMTREVLKDSDSQPL